MQTEPIPNKNGAMPLVPPRHCCWYCYRANKNTLTPCACLSEQTTVGYVKDSTGGLNEDRVEFGICRNHVNTHRLAVLRLVEETLKRRVRR